MTRTYYFKFSIIVNDGTNTKPSQVEADGLHEYLRNLIEAAAVGHPVKLGPSKVIAAEDMVS